MLLLLLVYAFCHTPLYGFDMLLRYAVADA